MRKGILFLYFLLSAFASYAGEWDNLDNTTSEYLSKRYIEKGDTLPYRILFPEHFDSRKKYPVLFMLHGNSARGRDNIKQLSFGADVFLKDNFRHKYPWIIVYPQCPENDYWANIEVEWSDNTRKLKFFMESGPTRTMQILVKLSEKIFDLSYTDNTRVYLGGMDIGGMGVLDLIRRSNELFAAAFVIGGGDEPLNVKKYNNMPLWFFHGENDTIVPLIYSQEIVEAMRNLDMRVIYTVYPDIDQQCWKKALNEPKLFPWLLSFKKTTH